jgi:hypothetical protein
MLATQGSERLALFTLATTVVGTLATAFFYWLQTQLEVNRKAAEEAGKKAEDAAKEAGKKSEDAGKKSEDAAKEAGKKAEDIMDLIRNEHRESIRDNKFSNRFVVLFSVATLGVSWLSSLAAGLQLRS